MCSECKKILEQKFKGAILASAKEYFNDIRVQINFIDFVSHIRVKYFIAKKNNPELINVSPGYFYTTARNLKEDYNNQSSRTINLEFERNTISRNKYKTDLDQIDIRHSEFINEQYEKDKKNRSLIKILIECKDYVSNDEFNALMSVFRDEDIKNYQIRNNFNKSNSARKARMRFIEKAAKKIRDKYPNGLGD